MDKSSTKKSIKNIYYLTACAVMTAMLCIVGPLSIPIGAVPVSLATFVIYLAAWILGAYGGRVSVIVYILLGIVGLPVFTGGGSGIGKVTGPTGGYIAGYVLLVFVSGTAVKLGKRNVIIAGIGMVVATAVLYTFGTLWFMHQAHATMNYALTVCVWPFIPFDMVKIVMAAVIGKPVDVALSKAGIKENLE